MSRSYRHTPILKDGSKKGKKWAKNQANRKIRHYKYPLANGKVYRKLYCSWNITDHVSYWPKQRAIHSYNTSKWRWWNWRDDYATEQEFIERYWAPTYYWK